MVILDTFKSGLQQPGESFQPEPYPPLVHGHYDGTLASTFLRKFKFLEWQIVYFCWQHN